MNNLIRVGHRVINLDNVASVELYTPRRDWVGETSYVASFDVVVNYAVGGAGYSNDLVSELFNGEDAYELRRYFEENAHNVGPERPAPQPEPRPAEETEEVAGDDLPW